MGSIVICHAPLLLALPHHALITATPFEGHVVWHAHAIIFGEHGPTNMHNTCRLVSHTKAFGCCSSSAAFLSCIARHRMEKWPYYYASMLEGWTSLQPS